jgi:hypothetical protein
VSESSEFPTALVARNLNLYTFPAASPSTAAVRVCAREFEVYDATAESASVASSPSFTNSAKPVRGLPPLSPGVEKARVISLAVAVVSLGGEG